MSDRSSEVLSAAADLMIILIYLYSEYAYTCDNCVLFYQQNDIPSEVCGKIGGFAWKSALGLSGDR